MGIGAPLPKPLDRSSTPPAAKAASAPRSDVEAEAKRKRVAKRCDLLVGNDFDANELYATTPLALASLGVADG